MKNILIVSMLIIFFAASSCKKQNCKFVTIKVVNGCTNPVTTTTTTNHQEFCGDDLVVIRKQAGFVDVPTGSGTCRITTLVIEQ